MRREYYQGRHYTFSSVNRNELDQEIYDWIYICSNYFNLKPDTRRQVIFVMKACMSDYQHLAPQIRFENLVLGAIKLACDTSDLLCYYDVNDSMRYFVMCTYGKDRAEKEYAQIMWVAMELQQLFYPPDSIINQSDIELMVK